MVWRNWLLAAFGVLAACSGAAAQETGLLGREIQVVVRSAVTNQPVPGTVASLESEMGESILQQTPQGNGYITFTNLKRGAFYVSVMAPGHVTARERADLNQVRRITIQILLRPKEDSSEAKPVNGAVHQKYLQVPEAARKEFEKGSRLLREKKTREGIDHLQRAIGLHAEFLEAHLLLGTAFMDIQDWKQAQTAFEKTIQLDSKEASAQLALGACLAMQGQYAAAEAPLKRGIEMKPESADGHFELGRVYWALGRWQEAEPHARKALELRPQAPMAHLLMGNILLQKREPANAIKEFREYLRLDPKGAFAAQTQDVIRKLEEAATAKKP